MSTHEEDEFVPVPTEEQLDVDEGEGANAIAGGTDTDDLDDYRDRTGPVWSGE